MKLSEVPPMTMVKVVEAKGRVCQDYWNTSLVTPGEQFILTHLASGVSGDYTRLWDRRVEREKMLTHDTTKAIEVEVMKQPALAVRAMNKEVAGKLGQVISPLSSIYFGSDPEVFGVDRTGTVVPAWLWTGEKAQGTDGDRTVPPKPYWDGWQAEFTLKPWACHAYGVDTIRHGLKACHDALTAKYPGGRLVGTPLFEIPEGQMAAASDHHVALGCRPSENAYGAFGQIPTNGRQLPVRMAGWHVHMATATMKPVPDPVEVVKMVDRTAGLLSVALLARLEHPLRRMYYGLAGEYRLPKHGLEYRTLSSACLWHPAICHLMLDMSRWGMYIASRGMSKLFQAKDEEVQEAINTLDVPLARRIIRRNRALFESGLTAMYSSAASLDAIILKGVRHHIELDMAGNWKFDGDWEGHSDGPGENYRSWSTSVLAGA